MYSGLIFSAWELDIIFNITYMNRRNFFKISSFAAGAIAFTGIAGPAFNKLIAGTKKSTQDSFSIELITDDENKAIKLVEEVISTMKLNGETVKFSEFRLDKSEKGDILLIRNSKLINYKSGTGDTEKMLKVAADSLNLPRVIENPVRLRFYVDGGIAAAKNFLICRNDFVLKKIDAEAHNINFNVSGKRGDMTINVDRNKARIVLSSCTHKNCINTGSISLRGESIVCIPNEIQVLAE